MSNIYIQEPPTNGKILLETSAGDIDIELWSREAPKACRNFIQLCMENYYDGVIFHRLVKGFIVQGGDPTGSGRGGNSIWGKPFKDEFHSRLRFSRRGLVCMANAGKDDNGSQFFFTLGPTPELQNKHTIFGKITGDTVYNISKFEDGEIDEDERPLYPHKILRTRILSNPFDDIVPREVIRKEKTTKNKSSVVGTKNYKLLSFGAEAEEEEEEVAEINKQFTGKGKSSHDLTSDPKLSSVPAVDVNQRPEEPVEDGGGITDTFERALTVEAVKEKLKKRGTTTKSNNSKRTATTSVDLGEDDDEEGTYYLGKDEELGSKKKIEMIQSEFKKLKRELKKADQNKARGGLTDLMNEGSIGKVEKLASNNSLIKDFFDEQKKYKEKKVDTRKTGSDREAETLALLSKFQSKISTAKETFAESALPDFSQKLAEDEDVASVDDGKDISWLARKLQNKDETPVVAKDANLKTDDWFEIYDPRNPLNKRRRGEEKSAKAKEESSWKKSKMLT